mgnify:CR=1 FL=1
MNSSDVDLTRRGFLRGRMLTSEGRERQEKEMKPLGPVIPWLQQVVSMETCGDCAQPCVSSCSQQVIANHPQSHQLAGTPYLDFSQSGCTWCGDCTEACPELDQCIDPVGMNIGTVELNRQQCHAWNGVFCMSCIGYCDATALSLNPQRQLQIDAALCNGCGRCVSPCPGTALSVKAA